MQNSQRSLIKPLFKKHFSNVACVFLGLLSTIIMLELLLRVFPQIDVEINNPYKYTRLIGERKYGAPFHFYSEAFPLFYDARKYYKQLNGCIGYYFNQLGARWISHSQELKGENVLVLGDSFTFGYGLDYKDTYIFKTQDLLAKEGIYLNFFNFAEPAADSQRCLAIYRSISHLPHKYLIYGLHVNDLIKFPTSYIANLVVIGQPPPKPNRFSAVFLKFSEGSKLSDFIVKRIRAKKSRDDKIRELVSFENFQKDYFIDNFNAIKEMDSEAGRNGAEFFVLLLPILADIKDGAFKPVYDKIIDALNGHNIKCVDLTSGIKGYRDNQLWILPFDQHPNEIANRIFAFELSGYFKQDVLQKK